MTYSNLETGKNFIALLDGNKNYAGAAELLAEDFRFVSPKFNAANKNDWLTGFPEMHKDAPIFEGLVVGANDKNTLTRKGTKKVGFINFSLVEIIEFNEEGKIQSITGK
eukprot:CAMPEP_0119028258 /NCGR_PEP_ID=MMETSP1176-20130426/38574_1 /TAXON_ID=265551 /ORGANISM="Synedropsis recta cf, Strain CCMP1620" /LENGTH=108 /DNA_ID=CAMNT_0006984351 /DNA_START=11 /DNA_END=334 /DNA_ORIENTATION=+